MASRMCYFFLFVPVILRIVNIVVNSGLKVQMYINYMSLKLTCVGRPWNLSAATKKDHCEINGIPSALASPVYS